MVKINLSEYAEDIYSEVKNSSGEFTSEYLDSATQIPGELASYTVENPGQLAENYSQLPTELQAGIGLTAIAAGLGAANADKIGKPVWDRMVEGMLEE